MRPEDDQPQPPPQPFDQRAGSDESPDLMAHADPMPEQPAPPEPPPPPPPIQIKPLLPETAQIPITPPPAPLAPVQPIEAAPDKSAPPMPPDAYDPTTKPAEMPKSPMPFDPFDKSTWPRADKAAAQDRTNKSIFGMLTEFWSRLFKAEKELEETQKRLGSVYPPRPTDGTDDGSSIITIIAVDLSNPTGDPGSDTTQCALRYDVTNSVTGESIATNVAMDGNGRRDPIGTMTPGTKGWGFMKDIVFYLRYADEKQESDECVDESTDVPLFGF